MTIQSPGKINLYLEVGPKRADGYHPLRSLFIRLALADVLSFGRPIKPTAPALQFFLEFDKDYPPACRQTLLRNWRSNSVLQAYRLLLKEAPALRYQKLALTLFKRLPIGAGLGGGSSNAAHALLGLIKICGLVLPQRKLLSLGQQLGSDVCFFLKAHPDSGLSKNPSAFWWATGRGEKLKDAKISSLSPLLIVYPGFAISSKRAYRALDSQSNPLLLTTRPVLHTLYGILRKGERGGGECLRLNTFMDVCWQRHPTLRLLHEQLSLMDAPMAGLTGSGSCLYALGNSLVQCQKWVRCLKQHPLFKNMNYYLTRSNKQGQLLTGRASRGPLAEPEAPWASLPGGQGPLLERQRRVGPEALIRLPVAARGRGTPGGFYANQ